MQVESVFIEYFNLKMFLKNLLTICVFLTR